MQKKIRVLAITPYEGMKTLLLGLADEYPDIELTTFVGDLEQGLEVAKNNNYGNYDVAISRGATAEMLRKHLTIPVIEIEISVFDMLCALKLADGFSGKTALVSFADLAESVQQLCGLMEYSIDIYPINSLDSLESTLKNIQKINYQAILCDVIANTAAKRMGLNSYLITSGKASIRRTLDQALMLCYSQQNFRDEALFFKQLAYGQQGYTVVFDDDGSLFFSTLENPGSDLLSLLRQEIPSTIENPKRRVTHNVNGTLYTIRAQRFSNNSHTYIAFFFDIRKTPQSTKYAGIRFSTRTEEETAYYNSIFSFTESSADFQSKLTHMSQSPLPLLIAGEDGTGKEFFASAIYISSPLQSNPLVSINCSLLNDRAWEYLLEHYNSPLTEEGFTLYFSNIDALSSERSQQLLSALSEMGVCKRNRVIFSCLCDVGEYTSPVGSLFVDNLCCLSLYLPPLRQTPDRIPTLLNLSLSHLNISIPHQIVGAEAGAIALLQKFPWPHNHSQFHRVVNELIVTASGQLITTTDVQKLLQKERHVGTFSLKSENAVSPLDLNRPLAIISQDIAIRVLAETDGNQTAAAKRLGISRTTLWRLLQK